jgi:predicted nucleic acid-binding protein
MTILDAGVVLALVLPSPFSEQAATHIRALREACEELYAPALLEYEVCSALRRSIVHKLITVAEATDALEIIRRLGVVPITPASSLHDRAIYWSDRLGQTKAYDAQYLALAEQMHCNLLTTDLRLARAARDLGVSWVVSVE